MKTTTRMFISATIAGLALFGAQTDAHATDVAEAFIGTFMPHGLDGRDYVDQNLDDLRNAMQSCYEDQLAYSPDLDGLMMLRVRPAPMGGTPDVELLSNQTGSGALASCVESSLEQVSMTPTYVEGAAITLPVTFRVRDSSTTVASR